MSLPFFKKVRIHTSTCYSIENLIKLLGLPWHGMCNESYRKICSIHLSIVFEFFGHVQIILQYKFSDHLLLFLSASPKPSHFLHSNSRSGTSKVSKRSLKQKVNSFISVICRAFEINYIT